MEKGELCWIIMKKKRTGFLTLQPITMLFYDTTMGEPEEDAEGHVVEDDLGQMLREAEEVCETEK